MISTLRHSEDEHLHERIRGHWIVTGRFWHESAVLVSRHNIAILVKERRRHHQDSGMIGGDTTQHHQTPYSVSDVRAGTSRFRRCSDFKYT